MTTPHKFTTAMHTLSTGPIFSAPLKLNLTLKPMLKGGGKCNFKVKVEAENIDQGERVIPLK